MTNKEITAALRKVGGIANNQRVVDITLKEEVEANPLLARIETRAGHGAGKPTAKVIQQNADVYSFVAACTGTGWVLK